MKQRIGRLLLGLVTGIFLFPSGLVFGQPEMTAGISIIKVIPENREKGILSVTIQLEATPSFILPKTKDTLQLPIQIVGWMEDENNHPVSRAEKKSKAFPLLDTALFAVKFYASAQSPTIKNLSIHFPAWQLNLEPGKHTLHPVLVATVGGVRKMTTRTEGLPFQFNKPQPLICQFQFRGFVMDTSGPGGGAWDFALFNKKEKAPDLQWILLRGGEERVFESFQQNNRYKYEGTEEDKSRFFLLSQGDEITLSLRDYDVTSFSDIVGEKTFVMTATGAEVTLENFDNVRMAVYKAWTEEAPRFEFHEVKFSAQKKDGFPSGRVLEAGFNSLWPWPVGEAWVSMQSKAGGIATVVPQLKMVLPSRQSNLSSFYIPDRKGKLQMVVPHYAFSDSIENLNPSFVLQSGKKIGDFFFITPPVLLPSLPLGKPMLSTKEVTARLNSVHQVEVNGLACFRLQWIAQIPSAYIGDLPKANLIMEATAKCGNRPVPLSNRLTIPLATLRNLKADSAGNISCEITDDVPLYRMPFPGRASLLDVQATIFLEEPVGMVTHTLNAGLAIDTATVMVPVLTPVSLQLAKATLFDPKVKEKKLSMCVFLGDNVMHETEYMPGNFHMKWNEECQFVSAPSDAMRILILHEGAGGVKTWIGKWEGKAEDLTGPPGKKIVLRGTGIRKLEVRVGSANY